MTRTQHKPITELPQPEHYLATECECVQGELLDLAEALNTAALPECAGLVPTFLAAVREFRKHLHEHVSAMERPAGLYDYLTYDAPALGSDLANLSREHFEMDEYLGKLEQSLQLFNPADPASIASIRAQARGLAALTCCHQRHGCALARKAGRNVNEGR